MKIEEKINYYKESLECFDDTMEKYKFLLDQGKKAKPFPEEFRLETFKVSGCQAQVWLVPFINNKLLSLGPASNNKTEYFLFSASLDEIIAPALPDPTTI